jgi:competence ComEA-like helix-hairpin-helix protein
MYYNPAMASRSFLLRSFLPILFVGLLFPAAALAGKKKPPAQPININTATADELQLVPGIGPVTAGKILQMRKSYGSFKSVDDLLAIRGLGPKRLEKMRKYLTVGKTPAAKNNPAKENVPPKPVIDAPPEP